MALSSIPEYIDGLPNICGSEELVTEAASRPSSWANSICLRAASTLPTSARAFAIALHMHQPLIPAGGDTLQTARVISNLKYMMDHPEIGDNHNAPVFHWCYKRMGEFHPTVSPGR